MVGPRPLGGRCVLLGWGGHEINVHVNLHMKSMLRCSCRACIQSWGWGGVGWDNNGSATHTSWYATVRCVGLPRVRHAMLLDVVLDFYIYIMLRYWLLSCTSTHTSCHAMFPWVSTHTSCYVIYIFLDFHTYVMLPNWTLSWTSTHKSCNAMFS